MPSDSALARCPSVPTTALRRLLGKAALATLLVACGSADGPDESDDSSGASTLDLNASWQPFKQTSVWNLRLAPTRTETSFPAVAWTYGLLAPSDADYGIKVYFAKTTDPVWQISFSDYNSVLDVWNTPNPTALRAPAGLKPPTGSDGTVILVDPSRRYAYEMWQLAPKGGTTASASSINVVDLQSLGIHRNVGITASGLPGIGGLLKSWELKNNVPIAHKLWLAVNPKLLYAQAVAPAVTGDVAANGKSAFVRYGDVIALGMGYNIDANACRLSPVMKRIARALQDYGGIVQDQGGDAVSLVAEVDAVANAIGAEYHTTMWKQVGCLQKYLVKVDNPWVGAVAGGLGVP